MPPIKNVKKCDRLLNGALAIQRPLNYRGEAVFIQYQQGTYSIQELACAA